MPIFEITSPDGVVYEVEGPEGSTEEQALQQVMAQHQQEAPKQPPKEETKLQALARYAEPLVRPSGLAARSIYQGAAGLFDVIPGAINVGQIIKEQIMGEPQPRYPMPVSEAVNKYLNYIGVPQPETTTERMAVDIGSGIAGGGIVGQKLLGALGALGSSGAREAGLGEFGQVMAGAALSGAPAISRFKKAIAPKKVSAKERKTALSKEYEALKSMGGEMTMEENVSLADSLKKLRPEDPHEARIWGESQAAKEAAGILGVMQETPMTFRGALANRGRINDLIRGAKGSEEVYLNQLKDSIDEAMLSEKAPTKDIEVRNRWQKVNHEWAKESTLADFELMTEKAGGKAQPANSLDTAINNFLTSRKSRFLTKQERKVLEDVVDNDSYAAEIGKSAASRLATHAGTAVGAVIGGPKGAIAGHVLSTIGSKLTRDALFNRKLKKLDKFYDMVKNRPSPKELVSSVKESVEE